MADVVPTDAFGKRLKATESVKFRCTPLHRHLVDKMVASMKELNCAHNETEAWLFLLENWQAIMKASQYLNTQRAKERMDAEAKALLADPELTENQLFKKPGPGQGK